jgi:hypothetical protein
VEGMMSFFHFLGSEDTEVRNHLKKLGFEVDITMIKLFLLHQWHKIIEIEKLKSNTGYN